MACVTACPSGVRYDELIVETRAQIEAGTKRPLPERMLRAFIFWLFCVPRRLERLRPYLALYQRLGIDKLIGTAGMKRLLPSSFAAMQAITPRIRRPVEIPAFTPARGPKRGRVAVLTGCVQSVFFSEVNAATVRVLAAEGFDVVVPENQGCCGALSSHSGRMDEARRHARALIDCLASYEVDALVVNSAGCGSAIKEYGHLFSGEPDYLDRAEAFARQSRDVTEFIAEQGSVTAPHPLPVTIAYHDACHLAHAQQIRDEPRALLSNISGLELREIANPDMCCGSAGIYNILQADAAREIGELKAQTVADTGAELIVAGNPGCLMQLKAALAAQGHKVATAHTIEVLDAAITGQDVARFVRDHV
jgi:glycolate oxidase iron-sulfur subunit